MPASLGLEYLIHVIIKGKQEKGEMNLYPIFPMNGTRWYPREKKKEVRVLIYSMTTTYITCLPNIRTRTVIMQLHHQGSWHALLAGFKLILVFFFVNQNPVCKILLVISQHINSIIFTNIKFKLLTLEAVYRQACKTISSNWLELGSFFQIQYGNSRIEKHGNIELI